MLWAKKLKGNRKGSIQDILFIAGTLLVFAVIFLIGFTIQSHLDDFIQGDSTITTEGKTASTNIKGNYPGVIDNMFLVFFIFLAISSIILAALVRIHPIFIPCIINSASIKSYNWMT